MIDSRIEAVEEQIEKLEKAKSLIDESINELKNLKDQI